MINVSRGLQEVARDLDQQLERLAGARVSFSLFVYTEGRTQYISSSGDRAEIKRAITAILDGWEAGMPDIPAHEIS